jgi:deoxyribodipyrimidine photo-lyase
MLIYWHKRDLRLLDNPALGLSLELCREKDLEFLPIFGLETDLINDPKTRYEFSEFYQYGFASAAIPLYRNYEYFGIRAQLFYEPVLDLLERLNKEKKIKILVSHQEHGTDGTFARDKAIHSFCKKHNIEWHQIAPSGVIRNLKSRDQRDKLVKEYLNGKVLPIPNFQGIKQQVTDKTINKNKDVDSNQETPSRGATKWRGTEIIKMFEQIQSDIGPKYNLQPTSEKAALACLESFTTSRAVGYRGGISSPNKAFESGSRLSQYLAFGSVSLRYVTQYFWTQIKLTENKKIRAGILAAMQRLHWREHFIQRLEISPNMPDTAIHPDYDKITYDNQYLENYKTGTTGEPLIDACIRCLNATGFINFRMRAMLVSYGIFGLDIDWREIGKFLATIFYDYEPGIHWSQIQMQAGVTGINTIRVYGPHKQLLDQDPDCIFVKKWIPELSELSTDQIQNYLKVSLSVLTAAQYPDPIVEFKSASKINKAKTYGVRSVTTKESSQKVFVKHGSRKVKVKKKVVVKKVVKVKVGIKSEELF